MKELRVVTLTTREVILCSVTRKNLLYVLTDRLQILPTADGSYTFLPYQGYSKVMEVSPEHIVCCALVDNKEMADIHREFSSPLVVPNRHTRPTLVQ